MCDENGLISEVLQLQDSLDRSLQYGWEGPKAVIDKVVEELDELCEALGNPDNPQHIRKELGDILFSVLNLARYCKVDPIEALKDAKAVFEQRVKTVYGIAEERSLRLEECSPAELDKLWEEAKHRLSTGS